MNATLRAVETTAQVDDRQHLHLDQPLPGDVAGRVRVIVLVPEAEPEAEYDDSDLSDAQWHYGVSRLLAEDWAVTPEEDIYTLEDGEPFNDET